MIIYDNLQSNLSISFREEDFQRTNMQYNKENSLASMGAQFTDGASLF